MGSLATIGGAPSAAPSSKDSAPALLVPFTRAATEHVESFLDVTLTPGAGSVPIAPVDIPAYGFIRGIYVEVTASGGTGTAATYKGDAPFTAITDIAVSDVNGAPIYGPVDGYDAFQITKVGGLRKLQDPRLHPDVNLGTTAGNYTFLIYIPVEVNPRDALGALGNMNAASAYKLRMSLAALGSVYTANPTGIPTVRVRAWLDAWTQPPATSLQGQPQATEPPAHGTTSFWSKQTFNVNAGQQQLRLNRVGNYLRELIFIYRDVSGVRNKTNFPAPLFINWDTRVLREYQPIVWRGAMAAKLGLTGTDEAARALDTGVYVEDYCHEFDGDIGLELRDGWLPTVQSTRYELSGNFGAAGTLTVLTNDVSPNGEVFV
jgi:hypothetical protein